MSDYPSGLTLRPIERWPAPPNKTPGPSPFSAPWRSTLQLLDRELRAIGTGNRPATAILQIAMREQDFRLDGLPRANAVPTHPGVILSIESSKGPLSFPCDRFTHWQDNLRAIALSLEALRKVDRFGTTPNAEQYTRFRAIGSAASPPSQSSTKGARRALELIAFPETDGVDPSGIGSIDRLKRLAKANSHPDRNGGDSTQFGVVQDLIKVLGWDEGRG
ncbi:molecular chaperone DnaJ [Rhodococcus sp. KRD162]|uniref:molecular chaperone DnaJ n=1 Tax=Rhodococcus sp. KRD162 TaxID=2729725 RepID=UPI0019D1F819|nr:molecular chaperone DnaJ [Rhodococcus sp. KRD162]